MRAGPRRRHTAPSAPPRAALVVLAALAAWSAGPAPAAAQDRDEEDAILREADKIERSFVRLVQDVQESTVAVKRFGEVEVDGEKRLVVTGFGSGVIVSRTGQILTNVHVIEGAARVEVVFSDGEVAEAEVYSQMPKFDFAMLVARAGILRAADWASTDNVAPGHFAIAAGNPRGLAVEGSPVVTLGIISGLGRRAPGKFDYGNAIQTDAEINPGNSGGPLFDLRGRVVGINGKIATLNAGKSNVGVGYTIPAAQIQNFLPALASGDIVEPGYSGLVVEPATHEDGGVAIRAVAKNSPAAKVGVRAGDRIVALNNVTIDSYTTWVNETAMLPGGRKVTLRYIRKGRSESKTFTLEVVSSDGSGR